MSNLEKIYKQDWDTVSVNSPYEIPSNHPVLCLEHKQTRIRAYFDVKLDRFLSSQEASMVLDGYDWAIN